MVTPNELVEVMRADHAFLTRNDHKPDRERWAIQQWLASHNRFNAVIDAGGDPPDFVVDGVGVELVEAMPPGRKRGDEYRAKLEAASAGHALARPAGSLEQVRNHGHEWIIEQTEKKIAKGYDPIAARRWTLLIYANFPWADRVQWDLVEPRINLSAPAFARIEVVYSAAAGPVARTVYVRHEDEPPPRPRRDR